MTTKTFTIGAIVSFMLPLAAIAARYDDDNLPYDDVSAAWDMETRVAVSFLTDEGVIRGNDDGTFRPMRTLNRAEFMAIAMRLDAGNQGNARTCFPDVRIGDWFSGVVCDAKDLGLVRGYPDGFFHPERPVQYEEALKILVRLFGLPEENTGGEWYERYLSATINRDIELPEGYPGMALLRAQMARLVASFLADSRDELHELRDAQGREPTWSSSSSRRSASSSSRSSVSSASQWSSSSRSFRQDTGEDVDAVSRIMLLGTTSHVLGAIKIFPDTEPVDVTRIAVEFVTGVESIDALEMYLSDGTYLGRATYDSDDAAFVLRISSHILQIDRRTSASVYVRAIVNPEDGGGWSNESVQVDDFFVQANGLWSNNTYSFATNETFPESLTARARISRVENAGATTETLITGTQQQIGLFRIAGEASDSEAGVMLTTLVFQINKTSEVTLSNVLLGATDTNVTHACSIAGSLVTCSSIPASLGDIDDGERTLKLYGDIALSATDDALLQLILNDPGGPSSTGSVTWNDSEAIFTWVDTMTSAVRGTAYTR